jgi:hypothetical protein
MSNNGVSTEQKSIMSSSGWCFLGMIVGALMGCTVAYNIDSARDSLNACMKKLPRNQYCTMVAVPSTYQIPKIEDQ